MVTLFTSDNKKQLETQGNLLQKDGADNLKLSRFAEKYINNYQKRLQEYYRGAGPTIKVSEVLGSLALLYERIRNIVEYKGEQVLRRNAIERILKRLLWERSSSSGERISAILIRELIWAHYLPNDTIPKEKITTVGKIINKYLHFLGVLLEKNIPIPTQQLKLWLWGVASCEIEEALDQTNRDDYINLMYDWFNTYFLWQDDFDPHEKEMQIYLAIHRSLTRSDEEIMRYHLLLKEYPQWAQADQTALNEVCNSFYKFYDEIEKHLNHPIRFKLFRIMQKQVAPFKVFQDLIIKNPSPKNTLANPTDLEQKVREICLSKYLKIQQKVNQGIIRSILYIFITKVVFAMLIEVPYELYRFSTLRYIPIAINIVIPPAMMFLIGLTIKAPGENNTQRILAKLKTIVYDQANPTVTKFYLNSPIRNNLLNQIFIFIYLLMFILVFGVITYLLNQLHFTIVGMLIFFIFLSLVLLFGFRVRFTASELKVTSDREGFFIHIFNNLTMPFLSTGVYLSKGLAKLNFFTLILDFLIEAPLKTVIEVVEEWTSFIREKREEVVEVPE